MANDTATRVYVIGEAIAFRKTREQFGGLSNMASGFPLNVCKVNIRTSEALYQACRFPHLPELQEMILGESSPMTAKMRTKPYVKSSRPDWEDVRVPIMKWCLKVKLAQNWRAFGDLLLSTGQRSIVEASRKDAYWGAKPTDDGNLSGCNVLGRLLMELREIFRTAPGSLETVKPLPLANFLLLNRPILTIRAGRDSDKSEACLEAATCVISRGQSLTT